MTLLTPTEAAAKLGVAVATLACWRTDGEGPPYVKVGRLVKYDLTRLEEWVNIRTVQRTSITHLPKGATPNVAPQRQVERVGRHRLGGHRVRRGA